MSDMIAVDVFGASANMPKVAEIAEVRNAIINAVAENSEVRNCGLRPSDIRCLFHEVVSPGNPEKELFFRYGGKGLKGSLDRDWKDGVHAGVERALGELLPGTCLIRIEE